MQQAKLNHGDSLLYGKIKIENTNKIKYTNKVTNDIAIIGGGIAGLPVQLDLNPSTFHISYLRKAMNLAGEWEPTPETI